MDYRQFKVEPNTGSYPQCSPPLANYGVRYPNMYGVTPAQYPWYNIHRPDDSNWKWGPDPYGYYRFKLWQQACAVSQRQSALRHTLMGSRLTNVPHSYPLAYQYQYPTQFAQYPVNGIHTTSMEVPNPPLECPRLAQQPNDNEDLHKKGEDILSFESRPVTSNLPNPVLFRPYAKSDEPIQDSHIPNLDIASQNATNIEIHDPSRGRIGEGFHLQTPVLASHEHNSRDMLHMPDHQRHLKPPVDVPIGQYHIQDGYGKLVNVPTQERDSTPLNLEGNNEEVVPSVNEDHTHWNHIYQNPSQPLWINKPVSNPAALELMNSIMHGRASAKSPGLSNDWLDSAPALALDLLEEECTSRCRNDHLEDTVSANLDLKGLQGDRDLEDTVSANFDLKGFQGDRDLVELIMMDTELDKLLESIDTQDESKQREGVCEKVKTVLNRRKREKIKHVCEICGKNFASRANKTVHMRIHSGEKPYECEYCGKRFKQRSTMSAHLRIHTGDKPYVCDMCGRAFADYSSWRKHLRLHSGEKPFQCSVCNKRFVQSGNRDRHMKRHMMHAKRILKSR